LTDKDTVQTEIDDALERVHEEREHVTGKMKAYRRFRRAIEETEFRKQRTSKGRSSALTLESHSTDACEQVVRAFAETVRPHSFEDMDEAETVLETVSEELGAEMAVAHSPKTDAVPPKDAVVSSASERILELELFADTLENEEASLREARAVVEDVTGSILENDDGEVYALRFDELRQRHERREEKRRDWGDTRRAVRAFSRSVRSYCSTRRKRRVRKVWNIKNSSPTSTRTSRPNIPLSQRRRVCTVSARNFRKASGTR